MQPEPATQAYNDNYFYSLMLNSFNTASNHFDMVYSTRYKYGENDFIKSIIFCDKEYFDKLYKPYLLTENFKFPETKWTPIMFAVWKNNTSFFNHLIKNYQIKPNLSNIYGLTPLHLACLRKVTEYIKPLILIGADIYLLDEYGYTPFDYLRGYPIDEEELIHFYHVEQKWIRRKNLFLLQKKTNYNTTSISNVLYNDDLLLYISSYL